MSLVEEAQRLGPALAAAVEEGDSLRRLPDDTWKQLLESGFLRALQPARWGGGEVHYLEFFDAVVELARHNASAGWVAGVIGVHPWQLALFDERAQDEMWSEDPATMHSSSYNPTGTATRVDGGFQLSGRWSFSSGCDHCRGVNLGAIVSDPDDGTSGGGGSGIRDYRSFLLHPGQYRIEDNWHVAGLRATGSKDIVVDDVFVPEHRTQSHVDYALGVPLPGQQRNDGVLYRLPWSVVFNMALVAPVLGAARAFIETWIGETRTRAVAGAGKLADDPLTQRRLADAQWDLDAALAVVRGDILTLWDMAAEGHTPSMVERAGMRWHMNRACERIGQAVAELFRAASGRSVFLDHPLQRPFQDIQAALGHAFLVPDPLARAVGGEALGTTKPELVL